VPGEEYGIITKPGTGFATRRMQTSPSDFTAECASQQSSRPSFLASTSQMSMRSHTHSQKLSQVLPRLGGRLLAGGFWSDVAMAND
jgi:hypothetical protein